MIRNLIAIALNMFASGITIFFLYIIAHDKWTSGSLTSLVFPSIEIPLIKSIPIIGPILSGHNILTYFAFISVIAFYYIIYKTPIGLRIRSVGQNPDGAESVGINVNNIKMYSLLLSGFFGSLGGLYLSMGYVSWFSRDMTAGRGFIAIAAASLGGNMPMGKFLGSLLFGIVNAIAIFIATLKILSEFIQSLPYITTVIVLAVYSIQESIKKEKLQKGKLWKIILDCDPGHDDMMAIILAAASDQIDLPGITTVAGKQVGEKTYLNALKTLTLINKKIFL